MRRRKAQVTFKVPSWNYCNHQSILDISKPSTTRCRFCVKSKHTCTCVLTNEQLFISGGLIEKTNNCKMASCGFDQVEIVDTQVSPRLVAKVVLDEYRGTYKNLIDEGYSAIVADKLAREVVLGHDEKL